MQRALIVLTLAALAVSPAPGQTTPAAGSFDELSRRAAESLDSQPEQAVALYRQALKLKPSWPEGWLYLGASLYQLNRYSEARDAFRKGIPLAPENGTAWAFLGLCEAELGDPKHAVEDIVKGEVLGVAGNPQFLLAVRLKAATLLLQSSEFAEAMDQLQPLARSGDSSPGVLMAAGLGTLGISRPLAELSPEQQTMVQMAGQAAWNMAAQHPAEAEAAYRELVAKYPQTAGVHYAYGISLLERDPEAAQAEFQKELTISPKHVYARLQIASLQLKRGAPEAALSPAQEVVQLEPKNPLGHAVLGRVLGSLGQTAKAIAELETAVKLAPDNPQTHFYLEQAYRRAGRTADAQREKAEFTRLKAQQDPLSLTGGKATSAP